MMFSNRDLRKLLVPLVIEQVLTCLMGIVDTMMVTNIGSAAVSGVSLVDSINKLVIYILTAMSAGGTIICSQYLGRKDHANSDRAARQVLLGSLAIGLLLMAIALGFRKGLLRLIFGAVEADVMTSAETYLLITAFSYPFLALFNASAALYRAAGRTRLPMLVSACSNVVNIAGNAILMFVFDMGVKGAAIATTASTVVAAVVLLIQLRRPGQEIDVGRLTAIRPELSMILLVLSVGIPSGIENSMFQLGKLAVQSTVATLGTAAIAANAIVVQLDFLSGLPSSAVGTGLMTVAGQCIGAGHLDQAKFYIKKLTFWGTGLLWCMCLLVWLMTGPVIRLSGMEPDAAALTRSAFLFVTLCKPFTWPLSFLPVNGMRAAGDVKFSMMTSVISMWVFRVGVTTVLCRVFHVGLIGIWIGYIADWIFRSIVFSLRYRSGKWAEHHVIDK